MTIVYDYELEALTGGDVPQLGQIDVGLSVPGGEGTEGGGLCFPGETAQECADRIAAELGGGGGGTGLPGGGVDEVYAVQVRPENWDLDAQPYALYRIAMGDTFCGLGATYLGACARGLEIYHTGNNVQIIGPNPNQIMTQGPIAMPEEARQNMKNWLAKGGPPTLPGKTPPETTLEKAKRRWPWLIAGGVVLAAAGYAVSRG